MRLLVIPLAGGVGLGPLTRYRAVTREAKIRGHEVLFICKDNFCEIVRKFGYRTYIALPLLGIEDKAAPIQTIGCGFSVGLS